MHSFNTFREMSKTLPEQIQDISRKFPGHAREILFSDDFQPVLAMKFLVESEFQGQEPPRTQETTKTHSGDPDGTGGFGGFPGPWP